MVAGCKEESGTHQHTTYHTRPSFAYVLPLKGSRTAYDPPTDDASTNALSHWHGAYVQYVECRIPEFESLADRVRSIHAQSYRRSC